MKGEEKLSPVLATILDQSKPNDRHDALAVLRVPRRTPPPPRGRLRLLSERLRAVEELSAENRETCDRVLDRYLEDGSRRTRGRTTPTVWTIGEGSLPVVAVEVTPRTLPDLLKQADVHAVLPNQRVELVQPQQVDYAELATDEKKEGLTWGLQQLGIPELWETTQGADINVAVLDTGVYADHPALKGRVRKFVMVDPVLRRIKVDPMFDAEDHGTHVCGIIAGATTPEGTAIGVAPRADLLVASVINGRADSVLKVTHGIAWAVENGANIVSLSLSFPDYEPHFASVFETLIEAYGIVPVVAVGNGKHGMCSSPGNAHNALAVGAVERNDDGRLQVSPFSSGASMLFPRDSLHPVVTKPDVVAPGAQVYSAIPPERQQDTIVEYAYKAGTSMAAPHVAGVVALLMAAHPATPATDIMEVLRETAHHPDGARPDNRWGNGMIRPLEALRALA